MNLRDTIELVRTLEKELSLFNVGPSDPIRDRLADYFETQNVRITAERTASGKPTVAVLSTEDEVFEVLDIETLRELVDDSPSELDSVGISDADHERVLSHLKETTFTSYDAEHMLLASREIEDRARRVGRGTIHAGFQRCSTIAEQRSIYADLSRRGIDVHAYGVPDAAPPDLDGGHVHTPETDEIAKTWFVVFDGGDDATQKSALLAEERDEESFYGFWTYDAKIVDSVLIHLQQSYQLNDNESEHSEI